MSRKTTWAVVPVKVLDHAKKRLAGVFDPEARIALSLAMLSDVLSSLTAVEGLDGVAVISRDARALNLARRTGARVIFEAPDDGLNGALQAVARELAAEGCVNLLVLPADVPLASPAEISQILTAQGAVPNVILVPESNGPGTNALACSPPEAIAPRFGEESFARHLDAARARGLQPKVLRLAGIGLDIDTPADLRAFCALPGSSRTHRFLQQCRGLQEGFRPRGAAFSGARLTREEALALSDCTDLDALMEAADGLCQQGHGGVVSYSRKVFIPLTKLCRDVCHYCTFARPPRRGEAAYLAPERVLDIARQGAAAGCKEALFTLGDKPELRYRAAREALAALGHDSTLSYLAEMARLVFEETGLFPHLNPGVMNGAEIAALREVSVSQGLMLESASARLCAKGGPHHGSPDKDPAARIETIRLAGEAGVPFTSGVLIGIGETRRERIEALLILRDLHERHGHIQEIIIQNFRAKPGTRMASAPDASLEEQLWTIAAARLLFGPEMNIQTPPNLRPGELAPLLRAGINDWGGVSPVTPDHVNPEAPWPELRTLEAETEKAGRSLTERLAVYPAYVQDASRWLATGFHTPVFHLTDSGGFVRRGGWRAGAANPPSDEETAGITGAPGVSVRQGLMRILDRASDGEALGEREIVMLFAARGADFTAVCAAADALRARSRGEVVTYVVNRNVNYTNVCTFGCGFCAFSKGKVATNLRDRPYDLNLEEIARRTREAWQRGATEVCMQGGIHPDYDGNRYLEIARTVKTAAPGIHLHAFSPLEVSQGAQTLGLSISEFLHALREAGLDTLPGTAAEVLDDEVRAVICPDKVTTQEWLDVMECAHGLGLRTTATIMFGHVDKPLHWARHLLRIRDLQSRSGGLSEFVPLPFVHMEAPLYIKGRARPGPSFREAVLMHAVARLALYPSITNIQTSWVKMGPEGARAALRAGANDLGGTLMNESITRAAGAVHGQEMAPESMEELITALGRVPRQRNTLYGPVPEERRAAAFAAPPLEPARQTPIARRSRHGADREPASPGVL